jgi:cobalt-zinc-cadmium efflux system outer membrane protein
MRDNLERVRALARGEMERAWSELQSASERVTRYDSGLLQEARRAAEAAEFAYRNGALGVMDLLDARRTLRATQIDAAMARADHARALAAWQAGIPSSPSSAMPPAASLGSQESAR